MSPTEIRREAVVVSGYPKSGNTWTTRLVAELLGCPVRGFWQRDHAEIATEGAQRSSRFECFKAHQQFDELFAPGVPWPDHVIYVVRDPRDVVVSGAEYFVRRFHRLESLAGRSAWVNAWVRRWINTPGFRVERMLEVLLEGGPDVHWWVRIPWATHVEPFLAQNALIVRYEDLLAEPLAQAARICAHVRVERSPEVLAAAVRAQSFETRRSRAVREGDEAGVAFLRSGTTGQWRDRLSGAQVGRLEAVLGELIDRLGYERAGERPGAPHRSVAGP